MTHLLSTFPPRIWSSSAHLHEATTISAKMYPPGFICSIVGSSGAIARGQNRYLAGFVSSITKDPGEISAEG